jgi:hypothetical protein
MREAAILHRCMLALSEAGCTVFRANVGLFFTRDGRPVQTGLPRGFSDLFGFRPDLVPFFCEVKSATGRIRPEQAAFLQAMRLRGAVAVVARDPEDCVRLVLGNSHQ